MDFEVSPKTRFARAAMYFTPKKFIFPFREILNDIKKIGYSKR